MRHLSLIPILLLVMPAFADQAYLSAFSKAPGETLGIHVSTNKPVFAASVYKTWDAAKPVFRISNIPGEVQDFVKLRYLYGAQWNTSYSLTIGNDWESGFYRLRTGNANTYFTVKPLNPGSTSPILVLDNALTQIAYNNFDGKSLYITNSNDGLPSSRLSLLRPRQNLIDRQLLSFSNWTRKHGISAEYASMMDLQNDPTLLSHYKLLVIVGKSEYWSHEMRTRFDDFIKGGGNAMILGGCTMLWQVRLEGEQMVCYKSPADPIAAIDPDKTTTMWARSPVNWPENQSIGVSFRHGGYVNQHKHYMAADDNNNGGYTVIRAGHWVFNNTGLNNGNSFGKQMTIVGKEVDGADFIRHDGLPFVTGLDGTPLNFKILALAPAYSGQRPDHAGHATLGIFMPFRKGGRVFNAATIDWADGLWYLGPTVDDIQHGDEDPVVSRITMNVLKEFTR